MPPGRNKKFNISMPDGLLKEAEKIVNSEGSWLSVQDFIRESVKEKIERWKKEHSDKYGSPERVKKEE